MSAIAFMLVLPLLTVSLWMGATSASALPLPTPTSAVLYGCWLAFQAVLYAVVPGKVREAAGLRYTLNGWTCLWVTLAAALLVVERGWVSSTAAYDLFGPLLATANIFAFACSFGLYARGRRVGMSAQDYFKGLALNPRLGGFDLKFFCEGRPSLLLWLLFNLSMAAKQYQLHGALSLSMVLVNVFQALYVADYFFHEEAVLSTWDMRHEKFGWMLCWGTLVWVPFTYGLQALYLVNHPYAPSPMFAAAVVVLNTAGYLIFRGANLQKHRFRQDPAQGGRLLASGWWGAARHPNYLGDLCMALAWCLACGFNHLLPYFYFFSLLALLLQRERRDHARCLAAYGEEWKTYCRAVPARIVPGFY